jgi:hypothetical protein
LCKASHRLIQVTLLKAAFITTTVKPKHRATVFARKNWFCLNFLWHGFTTALHSGDHLEKKVCDRLLPIGQHVTKLPIAPFVCKTRHLSRNFFIPQPQFHNIMKAAS